MAKIKGRIPNTGKKKNKAANKGNDQSKKVNTGAINLKIDPNKKTVLNVGHGDVMRLPVHHSLTNNGNINEVYASNNEGLKPDCTLSLYDLNQLPDSTFDAVWIPNSITRLHLHEIVPVFKQVLRILKDGGQVLFHVPNLKKLGEVIADGKLEGELFKASDGTPVSVHDLLFGHGALIEKGARTVASNSGFTCVTLTNKLINAGFGKIVIQPEDWQIWAKAIKMKLQNGKPILTVHEDDINTMMAKRDTIDKEPQIWTGYTKPSK